MLPLATACSQDGRVENSSFGFVLKNLLDHSVDEISVSEAFGTEAVFLDAREAGEYAVSCIDEAVWVGYEDFDPERAGEVDKSAIVIVYCSVGYRSEKVAEQLKEAGFENVFNLYGGIFEWKNQGGIVVDAEGEATDKVHAYDKNWGRWLQKGEKVY